MCITAHLFCKSHSALTHVHICPGKLEEKAAPTLRLAIGTVMVEAGNKQVEKNLLRSMLMF